MLVSVIISNYNYGSYVGEAIDSALRQTYPAVEVIVVDDGSTDNSREVIASFGDRIVAIFQPNSGQNSACNAGWRAAKGEIVIFLDSDDVLLATCVDHCVGFLEGTDKIKAQYYLQRADGDLAPLNGLMPGPNMGRESDIPRSMALCGYYCTPPTSGNAFRRSFLEKVMPVPEFRGEEYVAAIDGLLSAVAGLMGGIVFIPAVLGLYRVHGANQSDAGTVESVKKIRGLFMRNYVREQYQMLWAAKLGVPCEFDLSRFNPNVCKQRFLAYRLQSGGHPIAKDTRWNLLVSGVRGAFRVPGMHAAKRLFVACGFVGIAILPRAALRRMIGAIVTPNRGSGTIVVGLEK